MQRFAYVFPLALVIASAAPAQSDPQDPGNHAAFRTAAEIMADPPFIDAPGSYRAWMMESSEDFGVVLIEVLGTIPLHQHPDGNRRMFLIEGEMTMLAGEHEMEMKPGDFMYLPRFHHHKVELTPRAGRTLFILVDNPPVSTGNITWIEPAPEMTVNPEQVEAAMRAQRSCEVAGDS